MTMDAVKLRWSHREEGFQYVHSKRGGAQASVSIRGNSKTQPGFI